MGIFQWFFKPRSVKKIGKAIRAVSTVRADFSLLQKGLSQPWKITLQVIRRFEENVVALRTVCETNASFIDPKVLSSIIEQLDAWEKQGGEIAFALRRPETARLPNFKPFRIALQKVEHLLKQEKKRLS